MAAWTKKSRIALLGLCTAVCLCGSSLPAYAVGGGTEVDATSFANDWSFTVGLGNATDGPFCTGSLIGPSTVVTAAHCFASDPPDTVFYGSRDLSTASQVAIAAIHQNPAFDPVSGDFDTGIVYLAQPVTGVSTIRLATLDEESALPASVPVRFAGFGATDVISGMNPLHAGTGTVTNMHPAFHASFWALPGGAVSTCPGDSGGPLVATLPSGEEVLIGATHSGDACPSVSSSLWADLGRDGFVQNPPPPPPPPQPTPILVQSVSPASGPTPLTVSFDLTGSHWSDNRPIQYLVDPTFDPNTGSIETGLSTNATLSPTPLRQFTYTQSGTYTALVGILDANTGQLGDATVQISVTEPPQAFTVSSFSAPVDNGAAVNVANSGRTIPLKFRVTDRTGSPVSNLTANQVSVTANVGPCSNGTQTLDAIESYATASGLANLGNGYYQYDYKTLKTWAGQCATLTVKTPLTGTRTANFMFTK